MPKFFKILFLLFLFFCASLGWILWYFFLQGAFRQETAFASGATLKDIPRQHIGNKNLISCDYSYEGTLYWLPPFLTLFVSLTSNE